MRPYFSAMRCVRQSVVMAVGWRSRAYRRPGGESHRALMSRNPAVDWALLDDVILGCANQAGEDNRNVARMALLLAGLLIYSGNYSKPAVRLGDGRSRYRGARRCCGEVEFVDRGRGGVDVARTICDGKGRGSPFSAVPEVFDTTIGLAICQSARCDAKYGVDSMPETGENVAGSSQ